MSPIEGKKTRSHQEVSDEADLLIGVVAAVTHGMLTLTSDQDREITDKSRSLMVELADSVTKAIENEAIGQFLSGAVRHKQRLEERKRFFANRDVPK